MTRPFFWPLFLVWAATSIQSQAASPAPGTAGGLPGPNDPRVVAWIDPGRPFEGYPKSRISLQVGQDAEGKNIERDLTTFPDPGYRDPNTSEFTVVRTADPERTSGKAFRHKIAAGMSYRQDRNYQSARASIMSRWGATSPAVLRDGVPYWAAFAIYVGSDHPFDGSGDHISILSLGHSVTSKITQSMNKLDLRKDGNLRLWVQSSGVLDGTNATAQGSTFDFPVKKGVWNYIVIQWKYEWDPAKGPYTRVWRAVGNGPAAQIVDTDIPNAFRESAGFHPWKFGLYMWDVNKGWGSSPTRTIYTKGLYIFKDEPGDPTLDASALIALLRSI
ncbi:MAG: heparin lyase I family protein [Burkholderiales bacterium]|nr:heparin lyase I family protein [Burkholderiales bacterium]